MSSLDFLPITDERALNVELDWFERYVTKRPYTWEKAPKDAKEKEAKPMAP